ncbi:nucleolar complex protein 14 [Entomophthora muscae]|uniref:Nucleolar complex protein 14 n=1 Tax=Entomophthora muscae TaxID=34485 RepID=A0ACC2T7M8_9FUNG|nr:nucleolar complex protein 14 [Entomophthora muscae]
MAQHKAGPESKKKKNASALKRLRSSLKEAGLTGVLGKSKGSQTKKQRQGNNAIEAGKNQRGEKLALIKDAFNPFEIKSSKSKHEVLGRKLKGASGRPTLSKQIGIDNRKKTLLEDLKNRNRTGAIIDRRFGENNANMTPEEKMLERFTREKQKKARNSSLFNLEDDDEEDLTHFGQSLAGMDTFDDPVITDDEDDKGTISQAVVRNSHFGGFEPKDTEDENRVKSKSEVMKEVIAKSKYHKHERQKAKEDDENLRMELDEGLDEIKSLLMSYESTEPPVKRQPLAPQSEAFKKTLKNVDPIPENDVKGAEYDRYLYEMRDAQRAQATDRLKTEEEIAMEEKAALEKAERHRIRRMNGEDSDSEDEDDKLIRRKKSNRVAQADDLDDDLDAEPLDNFGLGEGVKVRVIDPSNEDVSEQENSEEESEDGSGDGSDEEDSKEDLEASDLEDSPKHHVPVTKPKKSNAGNKVAASSEVPFIFPIPQTTDAFGLLVNGRKPLEHETVIKRTRVLNHPKLAPENKEKLERFILVLLNYLENAVTNEEFSAELVNVYTKQITELALQLPEAAARTACDFLKNASQQFRQELTSGGEYLDTPTPGQLIIFSLFTRLFSTSDYHHAVISPLQLFLGQCLLQAPISTARCLARSAYICGLLYETQIEAKRFVPEAIASLCTNLYVLAPCAVRNDLDAMSDFFYNRFQLEDSSILELTTEPAFKALNLQNDPHGLAFKLSFKDLAQDAGSPKFQEAEFYNTLLLVTLRHLRKFAELYGSLSSPLSAFPQLFAPIASALTAFSTSSCISKSLQSLLSACQERIENLCSRCLASRFPLQLQAHRPLAIKTYLPKFDAEYSVDRYSREPNKEKANFTKLQRQHKRELRGAIRELRKDSQFLAREKLTTIKQKDADYQAKIRSITGELANNQGDAAKFNYEVKAKKARK